MKKQPNTRLIVSIIASAAFLGIVFYNTKDIVFGASFSVSGITNGMSLADGSLTISGTAAHAKSIIINGRDISVNRKGDFSEPILLSPGYNVVEVGMTDRFGKQTTKRYELVLTPQGDHYTLNNSNTYQQ